MISMTNTDFSFQSFKTNQMPLNTPVCRKYIFPTMHYVHSPPQHHSEEPDGAAFTSQQSDNCLTNVAT